MEIGSNGYTIIVSEKATEMLVDRARFLANVSEDAAINFIEGYKQEAKSLELFPERSPWLVNHALPINKYRKLIFCKQYMLIYQVKPKKVYLDYVLDCWQDYKWLL